MSQEQGGYQSPYAVEEKKGKGCLFYGCLTLVALLLLTCGATFMGVKFVQGKFNEMIAQYTAEEPLELAALDYSDAEMQELEDRIAVFQEAAETGEGSPELELTAKEANMLLSKALAANTTPSGGQMMDMRVEFVDDQAEATITIAIGDMLGEVPFLKGLKGRHINGRATLDGYVGGGMASLFITALEVNGEPVPQEFINELSSTNILQDAQSDPEVSQTLGLIESFEIVDGALILIANAQAWNQMMGDESFTEEPMESETATEEPAAEVESLDLGLEEEAAAEPATP